MNTASVKKMYLIHCLCLTINMTHCGISVVSSCDYMMINFELPIVMTKDLITYYQAREKKQNMKLKCF